MIRRESGSFAPDEWLAVEVEDVVALLVADEPALPLGCLFSFALAAAKTEISSVIIILFRSSILWLTQRF